MMKEIDWGLSFLWDMRELDQYGGMICSVYHRAWLQLLGMHYIYNP
jgi:hypothetical protein